MMIHKAVRDVPTSVAQLDARLTPIDREIFSMVILSPIQERQLSVSGETMCTILGISLKLPVKVWFGRPTALDMTLSD